MSAADGRGAIVVTVVIEGSNGSAAKPAPNAEIRLVIGSRSDTRRTGADGKYVFDNLLPGKYTIRAVPADGLKTKGESTATLTLEPGASVRADFLLTSTNTPTPVATTTPAANAVTVPPKPSPQAGPVVVVAPPPAQAVVVPLTSPLPTSAESVAAQVAAQRAREAQQASQQAAVVTSPGPLAFAMPGVLIAATPVPQVSPDGTTASPLTDGAQANIPPRRLVTSFETLRDTAGGGSAAPVRTIVSETSLLLDVPFRTQIDGTAFSLVNCGPASLAMVLAAFGFDVDPPSVRDYLNYLIGNYDTEQGTGLDVLARIAREAGLNVSGLYGQRGYRVWTIEDVREHVRAGQPVITLTKYRRLPGHFGAVTDFDHYIVITGLAGDDFVYNDAAYATEYGYNLLISPAQLERAWAETPIPRHAMAIGFGDSLRPLPIVPRRLTAASLVAPREDLAAASPPAVRQTRGPAAEWLREEMIDRLGARSAVVDDDSISQTVFATSGTRQSPAIVGVLEPLSELRQPNAAVRVETEDVASLAASEADPIIIPRPVGSRLGFGLVALGGLFMAGGWLAGWRPPRHRLGALNLLGHRQHGRSH